MALSPFIRMCAGTRRVDRGRAWPLSADCTRKWRGGQVGPVCLSHPSEGGLSVQCLLPGGCHTQRPYSRCSFPHDTLWQSHLCGMSNTFPCEACGLVTWSAADDLLPELFCPLEMRGLTALKMSYLLPLVRILYAIYLVSQVGHPFSTPLSNRKDM